MADLSIELLGLKFRNPILTAAGPTSRDGMTLLNAAAGGVGGLVAKTVSVKPADVPKPNMAALKEGRVGSRRASLVFHHLWWRTEFVLSVYSGWPEKRCGRWS